MKEGTPTQPTANKGIEISSNYTRQQVENDPNTAYVFTENNYSITAFPNRAGGGSAVIRGLANAFAIVTKKKYDYNTKENVDYTDTDANFQEFVSINTKLINDLKASGKSKIVFPQGFATDKAKMPERFAVWLQKELLDNFGLVTELNATKTGLISKSITQSIPKAKSEVPKGIASLDVEATERGGLFEEINWKDYQEVMTKLPEATRMSKGEFLSLTEEAQQAAIEQAKNC